jgi:hypothetical protein
LELVAGLLVTWFHVFLVCGPPYCCQEAVSCSLKIEASCSGPIGKCTNRSWIGFYSFLTIRGIDYKYWIRKNRISYDVSGTKSI